VLTTGLLFSVSRDILLQSTLLNTIYLRSILILSSHIRLRLPSRLFASGFFTRNLYAFLCTPYVPHAPPIISPSSIFLIKCKSALAIATGKQTINDTISRHALTHLRTHTLTLCHSNALTVFLSEIILQI